MNEFYYAVIEVITKGDVKLVKQTFPAELTELDANRGRERNKIRLPADKPPAICRGCSGGPVVIHRKRDWYGRDFPGTGVSL